jgi:hypothetical protein
MSFLKETNYSSNRGYDREPAALDLMSHLRLRVALSSMWVRLQIGKLLRLGIGSTQRSSLKDRDELEFGGPADRRPKPSKHRPISEIFQIPNTGDRTL